MTLENIITVDGFQVAVLKKRGVIPDHKIKRYLMQWAEQNGLCGISGVFLTVAEPKQDWPVFTPAE